MDNSDINHTFMSFNTELLTSQFYDYDQNYYRGETYISNMFLCFLKIKFISIYFKLLTFNRFIQRSILEIHKL